MGKKLYIGNLPYTTTDTSLTELFSQCGSVDSINLISDHGTGRSKGFGFLEMSTDQEAATAIEKFNGTVFEGRPITVNEARPQAPRNNNRGGNFRSSDRF